MRAAWIVAFCGMSACQWVSEETFQTRMDRDNDGVQGLVDCDDRDATVAEASTWYPDEDGDGYGADTEPMYACTLPDGYVDNKLDCDDTDSGKTPEDADRDGASSCDGDCDDSDFAKNLQDYDEDGVNTCEAVPDCRDEDPSIHPGAPELPGDGIDQDCDGLEICYLDADHDGARHDTDLAAPAQDLLCQATGLALENAPIDCDDTNNQVSPFSVERCNGIDDDCDTEIDEAGALNEQPWYADADGDLAGDPAIELWACTAPDAYFVANDFDCDDTDPSLNPNDGDGDGFDTCGPIPDCDDTDPALSPLDKDGDTVSTCDVAPDCDDGDATISPLVAEVYYDGIDQNCDGRHDYDQDQDGYAIADFVPPPGDLILTGDCDDLEPSTHPSAHEWCGDYEVKGAANQRTYIDSDCDGQHFLLDSVSGLVDGAGIYDLHQYDPMSPDTSGWFTLYDATPFADDFITVDPALGLDEIGICARSDQSAYKISLDLTAALAEHHISLVGYGEALPILDAEPFGTLLWADDVQSGNTLTLSNLALNGSLRDTWIRVTGDPQAITGPNLLLQDVRFRGVSVWHDASDIDLISLSNTTAFLFDVSIVGVDEGIDGGNVRIRSGLSCTDCVVRGYFIDVNDNDVQASAFDLVNSDTALGALMVSKNQTAGSGTVFDVSGGSLVLTIEAPSDLPLPDGPDGLDGLDEGVFLPLDANEYSTNSAAQDAGVIRARNGAFVSLAGQTFSDNAAVGAGGAIHVDASSRVDLRNCVFNDNSATSGGAAEVLGDVSCTGCDFTSNHAPGGTGGAVAVSTGGHYGSITSVYDQNSAYSGGAIFVGPDAWTADFDGDTFVANFADLGGAMTVGGLATLQDCSLVANAGTSGGAALHLASGIVVDKNSDYTSNAGFIGNSAAVVVDPRSILSLDPAGPWTTNGPSDLLWYVDDVTVGSMSVTTGSTVVCTPVCVTF